MSEQLFDPGPEAPIPTALMAFRGTKAQTDRVRAGGHPATGAALREPPGESCGSCSHCVGRGHNLRTYYKCDTVLMTSGPGTDIRRWWPACARWAPTATAAATERGA